MMVAPEAVCMDTSTMEGRALVGLYVVCAIDLPTAVSAEMYPSST